MAEEFAVNKRIAKKIDDFYYRRDGYRWARYWKNHNRYWNAYTPEQRQRSAEGVERAALRKAAAVRKARGWGLGTLTLRYTNASGATVRAGTLVALDSTGAIVPAVPSVP
jgi:hypothetical protein